MKRVAVIIWITLFLMVALEAIFPKNASAQTADTTGLQQVKVEKTTKTEVVFNTVLRPIFLGFQGGVYHDDLVQQGDVTVTLPSGIFFWVWGSTDFTSEKNFAKELDLAVGYGDTSGMMQYTLNAEYFIVKGGDVLNFNAELGLKDVIFVRAESYMPTRAENGPKKGWGFVGGFKKDFTKGPFGFSFQESVRYDSGVYGYDPAWILEGWLGLSIVMSKKTKVMWGVTLSKPMTVVKDGRRHQVVWEINLTRIR